MKWLDIEKEKISSKDSCLMTTTERKGKDAEGWK